MAPTKLTDRAAPAVVTNGTPPLRASRLPRRLRVPILVVLNLGISSALWTYASNFVGFELGAISKTETDPTAPAWHLVYKILFVWLGWELKYDYIDVSALTIIANAPYMYLLTTYYEVSTITVATLVHIEIAAVLIPTYLLRPRSDVHNPNAPLRNRFLLNSTQVQVTTALLGIGVYAVVIWSFLKSHVLNTFLITHFELRTLEDAHQETPLSLVWKTFVAGIAARVFLLNPSIAAQPASGAVTPVEPFDAATASLPDTLKHNFWFFSRRIRTLLQQTVVLNAFLLANTVQRCMNIRGTDLAGSAGYAGIWVFATTVCTGWFAWLGNTED